MVLMSISLKFYKIYNDNPYIYFFPAVVLLFIRIPYHSAQRFPLMKRFKFDITYSNIKTDLKSDVTNTKEKSTLAETT